MKQKHTTARYHNPEASETQNHAQHIPTSSDQIDETWILAMSHHEQQRPYVKYC